MADLSSEPEYHLETIEQARNAALKWLAERGVVHGPNRRVQIGRMGALAGKETGVESTSGTYFRIRLDYDPKKQAHYNVEVGKGERREKAAFCFKGGPQLIATLALRLEPR
jgi:hypothetical protein